MVVIARNITSIAIEYSPRLAREAVPDAFSAAIFVRSALDLVGGSRDAECELCRKV